MITRNQLLAPTSALVSVLAVCSLGCFGELEPIGAPTPETRMPGDPAPETPDADDPGADDPTGEDAMAIAREMFEVTIEPDVATRCAICHDPNGIGPQLWVEVSYEQITANSVLVGSFNPVRATLLTKGPHENSIWWNEVEAQLIGDWLNMEFAARNDGTADPVGDPGGPVPDAVSAFLGCMDLATWNDTQAYELARLRTQGNYTCSDCHSAAQYNVAMCNNSDRMFEQWRTFWGFQSAFRIEVGLGGAQTVVMSYDKFERAGNGTTLHPTFNYDPDNQALSQVREFMEQTLQRQANGECAPLEPVPAGIPGCVQQ